MKTKKIYNPPITEMVEVEFEGGFMVTSNIDTKIEPENVEIEVKGYEPTIENDVTFD